jgi:hypothetical protein
MTRRLRWSAGLALATVVLVVSQALAGATWRPPAGADSLVVGWEGTWNDGPPSIVRTGNALVAIYDTDVIDGRFAFDGSGRYMGVYALRSTNDGASFPDVTRISPRDRHAERGSIAATGSDVCVVYQTQVRYYARGFDYTFDPDQARYNFVRCSDDGGQSWNAPIRLPGQTENSRGDYPYIAAAGGSFYVVVTNSQNGDIWLWRSTNGGGRWGNPTSVGRTTIRDLGQLSYVGGYSGLPAVGATGSNVGVAWMTNTSTNNGRLVARVSTNGGDSFGSTTQLARGGANANGGYPNITGSDHRLAFTWTTANAGTLRLYNTTTNAWGQNRVFANFPDSQPGVGSELNKGGLGPVALLRAGTDTIGVLWTECNRTDRGICVDNYPDASDRDARMQLLYRESNNDGRTWGPASRVDSPAGKYVQLDWGWGLFVGDTPYAYYSAHNAAYGYYQMRLKICPTC